MARFTVYCENTIRAFQAVPQSKTILLLTPLVSHPADSERDDENIHPFEPFGHALSRYHKRIRHVPYIPELPFETHVPFVHKAGAILVVCCEPTSALYSQEQTFLQPPSLAAKLLNRQMAFVKDVHNYLCSFQDSSKKGEVPLIVVTTGPRGCV